MIRQWMGALALGTTLAAGAAQAQVELPKNDYAKPAAWLCWPGKAGDACAIDLTTTVIQANGSSTVERFTADPKAPVDCFYVYPTVSMDPGVVSDMTAGPEELNVVKQQLARFGSKCRIYAPLYRQFTLTALRAASAGAPMGGPNAPRPQTGYLDVLDAWNRYLATENKGRGVVLIGHSQGSGVLMQLIANEIDGKPVQAKIISALLLGTNLPIEAGKTTGAFKSMPVCTKVAETGCAIAYVTFRDDVPPPANSRFGKPRGPQAATMKAACVNPAALGGGKAPLKAYLGNGAAIASSSVAPPPWVKGKTNPATPFVAVPGLLTGECVSKDGFDYLAVHVNADPADPRTDIIAGDVVAGGQVMKDWGLHLIDVNVAMGDLVDVVGVQSKAWLARR